MFCVLSILTYSRQASEDGKGGSGSSVGKEEEEDTGKRVRHKLGFPSPSPVDRKVHQAATTEELR
jgi:hypothetical protein